MAKTTTQYTCQECGTPHPKWSGRCEGCGAWNKLLEETFRGATKKQTRTRSSGLEFTNLQPSADEADWPRFQVGIPEFDRVCGGGVVPGSVLLVGGDPGIGKSTLLLQAVLSFAENEACAYVSGEESTRQVRLRANRLHQSTATLHSIKEPRALVNAEDHYPEPADFSQNTAVLSAVQLASATQIDQIIPALKAMPSIRLVIIDSIQTMVSSMVESTPGTVSQVRACAYELIEYAKKQGVVVIIVGHVTKEGMIAGPRVLEHMVDTVLYFEGDRQYHYRILRSVKNRFGATDEIGVFEMTSKGLVEVPNPSALFLEEHQKSVSGTSIFSGVEGTRPILSEIQALVAPSYLPSPRRTTVGWDPGRLSMILAVLEARCGLNFSNRDVYLNVAGGFKITEPAADLAVAAALASALKNIPLPKQSVFCGEIGLAGEVRTVRHLDLRLKEAAKLGFQHMFTAQPSQKTSFAEANISFHAVKYLTEFLESIGS